jgi:hypothetical protein
VEAADFRDDRGRSSQDVVRTVITRAVKQLKRLLIFGSRDDVTQPKP